MRLSPSADADGIEGYLEDSEVSVPDLVTAMLAAMRRIDRLEREVERLESERRSLRESVQGLYYRSV